MTANIYPAYSAGPNIGSSQILNSGLIVGPTANSARDGSGILYPFFQAGANAGSLISRVKFKAVGSPVQTVAHLYWCSAASFTVGSTNTPSNTTFLDDVSLPLVTLSQLLASPSPSWAADNLWLPSNTFLLVGFGTSTGAAGTGWAVTAIGGNY